MYTYYLVVKYHKSDTTCEEEESLPRTLARCVLVEERSTPAGSRGWGEGEVEEQRRE